MAISRASSWRLLFRAKGAYNCALSIGFLLGDDWLRGRLGVAPADPAYRALFLALAFVFGLGYWWAGRDLEKNHDIIRMGILGQAAVFAVLAYFVGFGKPPLLWPYLLPGIVDLAFAVAFLYFLWTYPRCAWDRP